MCIRVHVRVVVRSVVLYSVASIPYFEYQSLQSEADKEKFLASVVKAI
jgi:hypothetical protein